MRLLKILGLAAGVLGAIAVIVVLGRVAQAQSPRDRALSDFRQLVFGGSYLGVTVRDVDSADVKREKLSAPTGAAVENVESGSPAEKAGVKAGDVFLSFDGEKVRSARHLSRLIEETPEGREVAATVMRNGAQLSLKMATSAQNYWDAGMQTLREYRLPERFHMNIPDLPALRNRDFSFRFFEDSRGRLGVGIQELTDQLGEYFGTTTGVLVTDVDDGTPAKTAGLKAGDVITKVNDLQVRTGDELRRRLVDATGDVKVTIVRDRKEQTVTVALDPVEAPRRRVIRRPV